MSNQSEKRTRASREGERTVVVARFADQLEAGRARQALEQMFRDLAREVADVFERNGGEAHVYEVAKIYALRGLRNDSGWEQDLPVVANGRDVIWALPEGAYADDAEGVMWQQGAANVAAYQQSEGTEEWRIAPHPMAIPILDEEEHLPRDSEDDDAGSMSARKPTLH